MFGNSTCYPEDPWREQIPKDGERESKNIEDTLPPVYLCDILSQDFPPGICSDKEKLDVQYLPWERLR